MAKLEVSPCKISNFPLYHPRLTTRASCQRPSSKAQAALIRETYRKAGLDPTNPRDRPQYFEAHGTGTPAGDPVEAEAIHSAFFMGGDAGHGHQAHQPLLVGSIKTVLGHSEGTAGIAAILKASLALQQSTIPPNLLLDNLNPRIEPFCAQLRVPTAPMPWPMIEAGQPRRASVNRYVSCRRNHQSPFSSHSKLSLVN